MFKVLYSLFEFAVLRIHNANAQMFLCEIFLNNGTKKTNG